MNSPAPEQLFEAAALVVGRPLGDLFQRMELALKLNDLRIAMQIPLPDEDYMDWPYSFRAYCVWYRQQEKRHEAAHT